MHATRVSRRQLRADYTFTRDKVVHATSRRHGSLSDPLSWKKECKHLRESMKCFGFSESLSPHTQHSDVKLSPRRCKGGLVQSPVFMLRLWEKMAPAFKNTHSSPLSVLPQLPFLLSSPRWSCSMFLPVQNKMVSNWNRSSCHSLFMKLVMRKRGHVAVLTRPVSRTSASFC